MDDLRKPFLVLAIVLVAVAVLLEIASDELTGGGAVATASFQGEVTARDELEDVEVPDPGDIDEPPGVGITYLALIDATLLYTLGLMGLGLVVPKRLQGRAQGVSTLIGSIILIIVAFVMAIIAFVLLLVMVGLFFAAPFGTIAYLALWGFFPRGEAAALLSLLMLLKVSAVIFLVLAQQAMLKQKGLMALILTSLVCNLVLAFAHGFVPIVVVSIVDALLALVFAIIAIVWGIILLIGSIPSLVATLRLAGSDD